VEIIKLAWVGTRTENADSTVAFFRDVLGLHFGAAGQVSRISAAVCCGVVHRQGDLDMVAGAELDQQPGHVGLDGGHAHV
jgi:catechol 2,3-dioxygenase-like lactoylglutathione lyase family enzyme